MLLKENYEIYKLVSINIKKYRKLNNMTQYELAKKSGYSYSYIKKIEGPKCPNNYSILTLFNISKCLNISIKCLFDEIDI